MDPSLYVILDRGAARGRDLLDLLDAAVAGGCRMVQLRDKEWPAGRLPPRRARPLAPRPRLHPGMVLGISTHSVEQARAAQADGADYIAVGSMFATPTKRDFQLV